jgi:hypothetical protein
MSKATRKNPAKPTRAAKATTSAPTANSSTATRSKPSKNTKKSKPSSKGASQGLSTSSSSPKSSKEANRNRYPGYHVEGNPLPPFKWRTRLEGYPNDAERFVAITHICELLRVGGNELILIQDSMVPRIPSTTLQLWREKNPEWDAMISDAFDTGGAIEMRRAQAIADGQQPLTYGHTTKAERAQHRADVKRDRMRLDAMFRRIEAVHRRYKPRTILEGDEDHPVLPAKYMMQPVKPVHDDSEAPSRSEEE